MVTKAQLEGTGVSKRGVLVVGHRLALAVQHMEGDIGIMAKDYIRALGILRPDLIEAEHKRNEKLRAAK